MALLFFVSCLIYFGHRDEPRVGLSAKPKLRLEESCKVVTGLKNEAELSFMAGGFI